MRLSLLLILAFSRAAMASDCEHLAMSVTPADRLFVEMRSRLPEQFDSFPFLEGSQTHWWRQTRADVAPVLMSPQGPLLDVNTHAADHPNYEIYAQKVSPDEALLAYSEDVEGDGTYDLHIHSISDHRDFAHSAHHTSGEFAWADSQTLFYIGLDANKRASRLYRLALGEGPELVYEERDPSFRLHIDRGASGKFLILNSRSRTSSESRLLTLQRPHEGWTVFKAREAGHIYELSEAGDRFIVRTNWDAPSYRLMEAPLAPSEKEAWTELMRSPPGVAFLHVSAYRDFLGITERQYGVTYIRVYHRQMKDAWRLPMREEFHEIRVHEIPDYNASSLRFYYSSPTTPETEFDYYFRDGKIRPLSLMATPTENFEMRSELVNGHPAPVLFRKGLAPDGRRPLVLLVTDSDGFKVEALSLAARGMAVVFIDGDPMRAKAELAERGLAPANRIHILRDLPVTSNRLHRLQLIAQEYARLLALEGL